MIALPDVIPTSWKVGAALLLIGVLFAVDAYRVHEADQTGYVRATTERAARDGAQKIADDAKAANDTKTRQEKADIEAAQRQQEKAKYEATIEDFRAAARRGNSGMRAPGACIPAASPGVGAGPAGGPVAETGYVLMPETAESVLDAAAVIRQGVLDRNALIDKFNECRAAANTP